MAWPGGARALARTASPGGDGRGDILQEGAVARMRGSRPQLLTCWGRPPGARSRWSPLLLNKVNYPRHVCGTLSKGHILYFFGILDLFICKRWKANQFNFPSFHTLAGPSLVSVSTWWVSVSDSGEETSTAWVI